MRFRAFVDAGVLCGLVAFVPRVSDGPQFDGSSPFESFGMPPAAFDGSCCNSAMLRWLSREGLLGFNRVESREPNPKEGCVIGKVFVLLQGARGRGRGYSCVVRQLGYEEAAKVYIFHIVKSNLKL